MNDCIFCKIASGEIKSDFLYRDDEIIAFRDINPMAPVHVLVIPAAHIGSLSEMAEAEMPLIGKMAGVANRIARQEGVLKSGYRVVINSGEQGGQAVPHLHMHLLGGRQLKAALG